MGSFGVPELLLIAVIGSLGVAILWWVARDARARGMNPAPWVVLVLLLQLIGLVIYIVTRSPKRPTAQGAPAN